MKLPHTVVIERSTAGAVDDYNQPTQVFATLATVSAWIQVKSGRELAQVNDAGPVRGEYRVFMLQTTDTGTPLVVTEGDHLVRAVPPEVYEIGFVDPAGGLEHHYQLDCNRVWP